jgi:hypothetical protein
LVYFEQLCGSRTSRRTGDQETAVESPDFERFSCLLLACSTSPLLYFWFTKNRGDWTPVELFAVAAAELRSFLAEQGTARFEI